MIASSGVGGRLIANVGAGAPIGAAVGALTTWPPFVSGGSLIGGDNNRGFLATAGGALAGEELDGLGGAVVSSLARHVLHVMRLHQV